MDNGYVLNGQNQTVMGMNIYTYDYFHPYDYMSGKMEVTDDTYAIHHFAGSWIEDKQEKSALISAMKKWSRNDNYIYTDL